MPNETFPSIVSAPPNALRILAVADCARRAESMDDDLRNKQPRLTALPSPSPTSVDVRKKYFGASLTRKTMSTSSFSLNTLSLRSKLASIPR